MSRRSSAEAKENKTSENEYDAKSSGGAKRDSSNDVDDEDSTILGDETKPPRRASVGWGAEGGGEDSKEPGAGADGAAGAPVSETKRSRRRKGSESTGSGPMDEIVEIPDLEEEEREPDITTQVAEAPRNTGRAVQSLKELDKDIKFALPNSSAFGVDLHLLTSVLCPERAVNEADEAWNFDSLLNEVSQEIQKDLDEKEEFLKADGA
ncbi:TPA: hypothetical protein N0F65_004627 [Lagenidium giganteum]|uniref:Intraflagellar transport protein 43 n=1 Tax=Lagenidium giganteum TaxID=4803 RepID=A0AAV2ZG23_9STRA|nr:TPA: hypothetical protein N0F65_004627 [Lagenidium giganteum]